MSLISIIKKTLIDKSFVKNSDFCNDNVSTYDYKMSSQEQDVFRVSVYSDSKCISVDIRIVSILDDYIIARRYEVENIEEFIFLISRTSRSPLFEIR